MNSEEIKKVANEFLKTRDVFYFEKGQGVYNDLQQIAKRMNLVEEPESDIALQDDDCLLILDIIWDFICKGYLAPRINKYNSWFTHAHSTKKGIEFRESL